MHKLFPWADVHDPALGIHRYPRSTPDVSFICVPTPNPDNRGLDCSIVETAVEDTKSPFVIIRSTVMPGTTDRLTTLTGKEIVFQPEYLGETVAHPLLDQGSRPFMILGGSREGRRKAIEVYHSCYNANTRITQMTAYEAEVVKLSENRAIAFKVAQCQELYDACEAANIDYYTVRDAVYGDDPRFNLWWTFIYPANRGFNSKCLPKDVYAWAEWAREVGITPTITDTLLARNEKWLNS